MKNVGTKVWKALESCLHFIVYRILHIKLSEDKWNAFMQFVRFGIVGVSNTVISYVIYVVVLLLLQKWQALPRIDYLVASVIAFILSVLWSFYWNNKYVFQKNDGENRSIWQALLKTYISYAFTGLFLNSILSVVWVEVFNWPKLIAPIINLLISVPLNFILNKFWAFRSKK